MNRDFISTADIKKIIGRKEVHEFKKFAFKGRMMEMSIAFIIGVAFQKSVESISSNLIMPFVNFFVSHTGAAWRTFTWTPIDGMTFGIGNLLGSFIDFVIISLILYVIYIKMLKPFFDGGETTKACPNCLNHIPLNAKRCSACTSWLENVTNE